MVSKEVNDFVKSLVASESGLILAFITHKKYLFHPSKYSSLTQKATQTAALSSSSNTTT